MDRATRKRLYNQLSPDEPLEPTDPRNVDIDKLPGNVRGGNFVENLMQKILLSDAPGCTFVTAQRGAGLTTELRRLRDHLSTPECDRQLVVCVDAQDVVALSSPISSADILFALWAQTEESVTRTIGKRMSEHSRKFWKWLTQTEVHVTDVSIAGPSAKFQWEARTLDNMRARFNVDRFRILNEIRSEMVLLNDNVKQAGYGGIVVVVDGLNRLRGLSTNWREVLDSAERMIGHDAPQWQLPVHLVMTAPSALMLRPRMYFEFLPYLPIPVREGFDFVEEVAAHSRLIDHRMQTDEFLEALGVNSGTRNAYETLLKMSAGCIGDILLLLRECVLFDRMNNVAFSRLISLFCDQWRRITTQDMLRALAEVHRIGNLDAMNRALAEEAMLDTFIVRDEPEGRYRVHPALHAVLP